jgi:segregation and condensation protein A
MEHVPFVVKHDSFEGPIEVLLELIEKRKFFVNDVPLALVTDDFIAYIEQHGMHPDHAAHFLVVAATLILIKARSLLPTIELTTEETESISDLERRVALYQAIRAAAQQLQVSFGTVYSYRSAIRPYTPVFAPDHSITPNVLVKVLQEIVVRIPQAPVSAPEARVYKTISLTEVLETLTQRLERAIGRIQFSAVQVASPDTDDRSAKVYTIVSFLGMLELVRRGLITAEQTESFSDISLEKITT